MSSTEERRAEGWLACLEVSVVFALILTYIWWLRFLYPYSWVAIVLLVCASHLGRGEGFATLGFVWTGSARRLAAPLVLLAVVALCLAAIGILLDSLRDVAWQSAMLSLGLYLFWGLFQQYLLNGYFVNRFSIFLDDETLVAIVAATFFALVHLPNWFLMLVTFAGGYICAKIYLRYRNLYILGMAHGVVGFLIYLVVPDTISHHLYVGPKWFSM